MNLVAMQAAAAGGGRMAEDRPHLRRRLDRTWRRRPQLRHRVRRALLRWPIGRCCASSRRAASRLPRAWPTPRRSRPNWRASRSSAAGHPGAGRRRGKAAHRGARAAAARVRAGDTASGPGRGRADLVRAREAAAARPRADARRTQTRGRPARRADHGGRDRQDPDPGRPPALAEETATADRRRDGHRGRRQAAMKAKRKVRRAARRLFRLCLTDGVLDDGAGARGRAACRGLGPRGMAPGVLVEFLRLVRLDRGRYTARGRERRPADRQPARSTFRPT